MQANETANVSNEAAASGSTGEHSGVFTGAVASNVGVGPSFAPGVQASDVGVSLTGCRRG